MTNMRFELANLTQFVGQLTPQQCQKLYLYYKQTKGISYNKIKETLANLIKVHPLQLDNDLVNQFLITTQKTFKNYEKVFFDDPKMLVDIDGYIQIDVFVNTLMLYFIDLHNNVNILRNKSEQTAKISDIVDKAEQECNLFTVNMKIVDVLKEHKNDPELVKQFEYNVNFHIENINRMINEYFRINYPNLPYEVDFDVRVGTHATERKKLT